MNEYLKVGPLNPEGAPMPKYIGTMNLSKGLVRSVSPRELDLAASPLMENIRFERTGIRKDFGDRALGGNAPFFILCIVEHKFIDVYGEKYSRLIRLMRNSDGRAKTEIWNSTTEEWEDDAITASQTIEDRFVRAISVRGVLIFACKGSPILERAETPVYTAQYDDFPSGNALTEAMEYTELTATPSGRIKGGECTVYFDVDLSLTTGTDLVVTVGLYVNNEAVLARNFIQGAAGSSNYPNEVFEFERQLEDGDVVKLMVAAVAVSYSNTARSAEFSYVGGTPRYQATKTPTLESYNGVYTYKYHVSAPAEGLTVHIYYDDGGGWTEWGESPIEYPPFFDDDVELDVNIDGMGAGTKFGLHIDTPGVLDLVPDEVAWEESGAVYSFEVHGHNVPVDADTNHGLEYEAQTGVVATLAPISDAPEATWIESFGDRIIALQDGGDTQKFSASADGTHDNWTTLDSVETLLVDTRNDPVDDLQCAGPLASNVLAVIRARSIMKAFETGNYDLAVGVNHWIEGIGTESPHSISITPAGLAFLGHDYMVYLLSDGGLLPIGEFIQQELIESLTANLDKVDGIYDPIFQEYWLGIPEDGEDYCTATYIFDIGKFITSRGETMRWRKRVDNVQRYAVVSTVE